MDRAGACSGCDLRFHLSGAGRTRSNKDLFPSNFTSAPRTSPARCLRAGFPNTRKSRWSFIWAFFFLFLFIFFVSFEGAEGENLLRSLGCVVNRGWVGSLCCTVSSSATEAEREPRLFSFNWVGGGGVYGKGELDSPAEDSRVSFKKPPEIGVLKGILEVIPRGNTPWQPVLSSSPPACSLVSNNTNNYQEEG